MSNPVMAVPVACPNCERWDGSHSLRCALQSPPRPKYVPAGPPRTLCACLGAAQMAPRSSGRLKTPPRGSEAP